MLEELRTPTAIGYSARRGSLADEVIEASYVEALASAQSKKAGIWGDGPR
jgi:endonuclease YncB( thermonuclease family)